MVAAIYARKSTEQIGVAEEQKSVTRQIDHAREYADAKGWVLAEEHIYSDDGISGAEFKNRPAFVRLMNALKARPGFTVLIMSEVSRLGREQIETAYAMKQLSVAGVRCFSYLEDRELLMESATDKFLLSALNFGADLEREKARQRTYDAMERKAKAGHVTGGRVFGYENIDVPGPSGKRSHVVRQIHPEEAQVVRRIFALHANGMGFTSIAKRLNDERAVSPRSQRDRPRGWSTSSVREVLKRPLYRGEIVWNKTQKRNKWGQKKTSDRTANEWVSIEDPSLMIIDPELAARVDAQLVSNTARYAAQNPKGGRAWGAGVKHLLAGLLRCSVCGAGIEVRIPAHRERSFRVNVNTPSDRW